MKSPAPQHNPPFLQHRARPARCAPHMKGPAVTEETLSPSLIRQLMRPGALAEDTAPPNLDDAQQRALHTALAALDAQDREILQLRYDANCTIEEIAAHLLTSPQIVEHREQDALHQLGNIYRQRERTSQHHPRGAMCQHQHRRNPFHQPQAKEGQSVRNNLLRIWRQTLMPPYGEPLRISVFLLLP